MRFEPETYEELVRMKRCIELTKHYELSKEELERIYDFLAQNKGATVKCGKENISLISSEVHTMEVIAARCIDGGIDGIFLSDKEFTIIPHYTPSSGSGYSGGSSSNNNNNNNNNNNS